MDLKLRRSPVTATVLRREPAVEPRLIVALVAASLFIDYFLYGVVMTLTPHSPSAMAGESHFGLLYGAYAASVLATTPLFGYLGDRAGGRATLIGGAILAFCAAALFGAGGSFWNSLLARLCQGAASAAVWTSGLALVAQYCIHNRVKMIGYAFTGGTAGSIVGPFLGGVLFRAGGFQLPFLVIGILAATMVFLFALLLPGPGGHRGTVEVRALLRSRSIARFGLAIALAAFAWGVLEPLLPVNLSRHGMRPETIGILFTAASLAYGLCAPVVARVCERLPVGKVIALGTAGMAATLPLLAVFHHPVPVGLALCALSCAFAFTLNPSSAELGNEVDRIGTSSYGAAYAVYNIVYSVGMLATTLITSNAAQRLGLGGALLCVSAVLLLSVAALLPAGRPTGIRSS